MPETISISETTPNRKNPQQSNDRYIVNINDHPVAITKFQHKNWQRKKSQEELQSTKWHRIIIPINASHDGLYEEHKVDWPTVKKILNKNIFWDAVPDPEKELFKKIEKYTESLSNDLIHTEKPNEIVESLSAFWKLAYKVALDTETLKTNKKLGPLNTIENLVIRRKDQLNIIEKCLKKLGIIKKVLQDLAQEQISLDKQKISKVTRKALGGL